MRFALFSIFLALFFSLLFWSPAESHFIEGDPEFYLNGGPEYPYDPNGETITAKFIFVAFDDDLSGQVITLDEHQVAVDRMIAYINSHSQGKLVLGPNSGILFHPDEVLDENTPTVRSWEAQLRAVEYRTGICDGCNDIPQSWTDLWDPRVLSWYIENTTDSSRASELLAEIFWTIQDEYEQAGQNPFDEEIGAIFVIFQSVDSPDATAGGRPHITLNCDAINLETDFFSNLKVVNEEFAGTIGVQASASPVSLEFDIEKCSMVTLHEFVHTLGPRDGPPLFSEMGSKCDDAGIDLCEYRYYYGNQNLMTQHYVPGYGIPPIVLPVLENMPWFSEENGKVIDFTGQNMYGVNIYDIRSDRGKIYKFQLGEYSGTEMEDFVIAYHAGTGVDGQTGDLGGPVLPSQGLEIWHRVGSHMYDLESSIGNWDYATANLDTYIYPGDCSVVADTLSGYDNHDVWVMANGASRDVTEYEEYIGEEYDFFQVDFTGEDARYNKDEFSFRTNPSSFGYNKDENTHEYLRRRPQDVTNSLVVKILGTGSDGLGSFVTVDLLSAPGGVVWAPNCDSGPQYFALGSNITITWEHDQYNEAAESVDILFSKYGGEYFQETLVKDLPIGPGLGSWDWQPTAEHGTDHGRIQVVFNNPYSDFTRSAINPCEFAIDHPMVVEEFIVSPNGGEGFSAGASSTIPITWTNLMANIPGEEIDSVDLEFSTDDGVNWTLVQPGMTSPGDFDVDPETGYNVFEMQITDGRVSEQARIRLHFHSGSDVATQQSESSFAVFPVEAMFTDVSTGTGATFQGEPYNAISLDYDSDDMVDLLISMQDVEGSVLPKSVMFRNTGQDGGAITFENVNDNAFGLASQPALNSHGLTAGDYDHNGQIDVFVSHESSPRLYNNADGVLINKIGDDDVINPNDIFKLEKSSCATWVDYDHDSDLDLFVGRVSGMAPDDPSGELDYIFKNNGIDGFSSDEAFDARPGGTSSAVWCDFNQDGLWDVVVGEFIGFPPAITTMYTETTRPGEYSEVFDGLPTGFNRSGVASLNWVDYDRDGDLDLFVKRSNGNSEILINDQDSLTEVVVPFSDPNWNSAAATPLDYNLDGWPDFVLSDPTNSPQLRLMANLMGNPDFTENKFGDVTSGSGLAELSGPAHGILSCDFNNDGDLDLFMGTRQTSSSRKAWLLGNSQKGGQDTPLNKFLRVDLISSDDNSGSLGAIVSVETIWGDPLGTQVVDGGSGLGGQMPRILTFGLGNYPGNVVTIVHWPLGRTATQTVASTIISQGELVTIVAGNDLQVFDSTIKRTIIFDPITLSLHWTIEWQTDYWSDLDLDQVTITRVSGLNCGSETAILQAGDPDVIVQTPEYFVDSATGLVAFNHKVEWTNQLCHLNCRYSIEVESSNGINTDSGTSSSDATFKTCPSGTGQGGQ